MVDETPEVRPCEADECHRNALENKTLCGVHFPWEPVIMGPTWVRGPDGKFVMPEKSLGEECLRWCYKYLQHKGKRWQFTKEQARIVMWWYAIDEDGEFIFSSGVIQRAKGTGKDYLIAAIAAFEMLGPCRFSHWDDNGNPVARRPDEPWVQIAAVSQSQTRTTMKIFPGLLNERCRREYHLNGKIGSTLITGEQGLSRIESVTSSPAALEGGRPSLFIQNETHRWDSSTDGHEMSETGRANAGKVGGRFLCFTNAYQPGLDSVAQRDREGYEDILAGRNYDTGIMYDSLEAPAEAPLDREVIPIILAITRGDSVWMPIESNIRTMLHPSYPAARARRFYYNQIVSIGDTLVAEAEWNGCEVKGEYLPLEPGDEITLGLDGSKSSDATALVAIRIKDKSVHPIGIWEPKQHEDDELPQLIDMELVSGEVANAFAKYKVRAFFSDVEKIESYVNDWSDTYREIVMVKATPGKSAVGFDMRGNQHEIVRMNESLVGTIRGAGVRWTRSYNKEDSRDQLMFKLKQHVLNCYQRPHPKGYGMSFGKKSRESKRKVDGYAAMLLAFIAMNKYLESGKKPAEEIDRSGWFF